MEENNCAFNKLDTKGCHHVDITQECDSVQDELKSFSCEDVIDKDEGLYIRMLDILRFYYSNMVTLLDDNHPLQLLTS